MLRGRDLIDDGIAADRGGSGRRRGRSLLAVAVATAQIAALPIVADRDGHVAVAAAHGGPKDGPYRGKTAEGARVSFRVSGGRVVRPSFTVVHRGCGVRITFTSSRPVRRRGGFFFGRRSSDFFAGRFVAPGRVRGRAGVDFTSSSCPGRGVHEARFRARRVR